MEDKNFIEKQDGNQVVIGSNSGTIHIHNSSDTDTLRKLIEADIQRDKFTQEFMTLVKIEAQKWSDIALQKEKERQNWSCPKCNPPRPSRKNK